MKHSGWSTKCSRLKSGRCNKVSSHLATWFNWTRLKIQINLIYHWLRDPSVWFKKTHLIGRASSRWRLSLPRVGLRNRSTRSKLWSYCFKRSRTKKRYSLWTISTLARLKWSVFHRALSPHWAGPALLPRKIPQVRALKIWTLHRWLSWGQKCRRLVPRKRMKSPKKGNTLGRGQRTMSRSLIRGILSLMAVNLSIKLRSRVSAKNSCSKRESSTGRRSEFANPLFK